jgi:glycerol-3-phosphate acyltransferase PlsX
LRDNELINFVGNIEANYVMRNRCDVLVTDGFTGNVLLKSIEGMGRLMLKTMKGLFSKNVKSKAAYALIRNDVAGIKKNFDSSEYGGAPILGIAKPVIKAHGSSNAKAFKNAIRQAVMCAENDLTADMCRALASLSDADQKN